MTNSESIFQFGNNAYGKPATALNILRETVMGRELFDHAFREFSQRWMFKHPSPADFFRTMEDASSVDLDWFWRGWFYTTDHVDMAIESVNWMQLGSQNPDEVREISKLEKEAGPQSISKIRNAKSVKKTVTEKDPATIDFYNEYSPYNVNALDRDEYDRFYNSLAPDEKALMDEGYHFYEVTFKNVGGLVMPLILEFEYKDGTEEVIRIPAEIWRMLPHEQVKKVFPTKKEVRQIMLDPFLETADTDKSNNYWPPRAQPSRFELFKQQRSRENKMQRDRRAKEMEKAKTGAGGSGE